MRIYLKIRLNLIVANYYLSSKQITIDDAGCGGGGEFFYY